MPVGSVLLSIGSASLPDGSSGNAAPAIQRVQSSAANPKAHFLQAAFDATTGEMLMWSFRMPQDYASAPVAKVQYKMASATTGNVVIAARIAAVSDGDAQDVDAKAFAAANTSAATAVPATAGFLDEISLSLTTADSLAANDFVVLWLSRDASNAGDTAVGDLECLCASLEYTTV
jgi:hypothetical protein